MSVSLLGDAEPHIVDKNICRFVGPGLSVVEPAECEGVGTGWHVGDRDGEKLPPVEIDGPPFPLPTTWAT